VYHRVNENRKKKKAQEDRERSELKTLRSLTPAEKRALQPYILKNRNSVDFAIADGVAGGLVAKKILYVAANVSHGLSFPHNLQPWAREHLTKHLELLEISESERQRLDTDEE
jgi:superinfection exclusion protein B